MISQKNEQTNKQESVFSKHYYPDSLEDRWYSRTRSYTPRSEILILVSFSVSSPKKQKKNPKQAFLMVLAGGAFRLPLVMMT